MKTFSLVAISTVALAMTSACNQQPPAPQESSSDVQSATASSPADFNKVAAAAQQQATVAKQSAERLAADLQTQAGAVHKTVEKAAAGAQTQAAATAGKAQSSIEWARQLVADKNWTDALKTLNDLALQKLTPEQQSIVDNLKRQAQKLAQDAANGKAADQANKALGDLLNKK